MNTVYKLEHPEKAALLFGDWQETIIWSCLQGIMGSIYADSQECPASAMAVLGDFCFLAGEPDEELVRWQPEEDRREFTIMVPQNRHWEQLIEECCPGSVEKITRYAVKKEPDVFDREALKAAVDGLPEGYVLQMIDDSLFQYCRETVWCRDLVSQYKDYKSFQRRGLGVMVLKEGEPVCGASSYSGYLGRIEIEIDTREDYRRRGLAYGCGARLILECLDRGWYPSWDAHNKASLALAEKLGYHLDHTYTAFQVVRENSRISAR